MRVDATRSDDKAPPAVVVVVPTLDEAANIDRVLDELLADLPAGDVRLIVADGGSTDGTQAIVRRRAAADPRIALVHNPGRLQSAAVNMVARDAAGRADMLVRCDAHAAYPSRFVARVIDTLVRTGVDSVVVPMDSVGRTPVGRAIAWVSDTPVGSGGSAHRGGRRSGFVDHGHHAGWRLASFLAAGGYADRYPHNEDAELDCRIIRGGGRVWLDADVRVTYFTRSTLHALWRQYRGYGRGRSRTVRRHPGSMRARQLAVPGFVAANLAALAAAPFAPVALALPAAYAALLGATSVAVAVRRRAACGLLAGPAALTMHVGWASGFADGLLRHRERAWRPAGDANDVERATSASSATKPTVSRSGGSIVRQEDRVA